MVGQLEFVGVLSGDEVLHLQRDREDLRPAEGQLEAVQYPSGAH
jgi:hypothetical protein